MARRGENIRKRKDGRWEGRYMSYDAYDQRRVARSVYGKTYAEVKEKLAERKQNTKLLHRGNRGESPLFETAAEEWLFTVKRLKKYATYRKYRNTYEKHIRKALGGYPVSQLSGEMIREILECPESCALSESSLRSIACVINQILSYAEKHYHEIPASFSVRKLRMPHKPVEVLNYSEQARLFHFLYEEMDIYKAGIMICISTGLRLGEICALKWEDIDLEEKLLHVNRTVQRIAVDGAASKTVLMEDVPKSVFSKREIPLSDEVVRLLFPYYGRGCYVINQNRPAEPRTYQNRFYQYLKNAGIERKNFHILCHTFATNCVASGADVKSLSEILGHSDVKITLNRYIHPGMETKREHLNALSAAYGRYMGRQFA